MNKGNRSNAFQSSSDQTSFSKEKMFDKENSGAAFNTKEDIGGDASKSSFSNASSEARSSAVEKTIKKNILEENKPKLSSRFDSARDIMRSAREASKDNEDENTSVASTVDRTFENYFLHKGRQASDDARNYNSLLKTTQHKESDDSIFKEVNDDDLFKDNNSSVLIESDDIPALEKSTTFNWSDEDLSFNDNRILSGFSSDRDREQLLSIRQSLRNGDISYDELFSKNPSVDFNKNSSKSKISTYIDYFHSKGMVDDDIKVFFGIDFDKIDSPVNSISDYAWTSADGQSSKDTDSSIFVSADEIRESHFDGFKDEFTDKKREVDSLFLDDKSTSDDSDIYFDGKAASDKAEADTENNFTGGSSKNSSSGPKSNTGNSSKTKTVSKSKEEQLKKNKKQSQRKAAASYAIAGALRAKRDAQDDLTSQGKDGSNLLSDGYGGALKTVGSFAKEGVAKLGQYLGKKVGKYVAIGILFFVLLLVFIAAPVYLVLSPTLMAVRAGVNGDDNGVVANDFELDVTTGGKRFSSLSSDKINSIVNEVHDKFPNTNPANFDPRTSAYRKAVELTDTISYALDKVGCEYNQHRRMNPGVYDCSSLVFRAYKDAGVLLPCDSPNWAPTAADLCYALENQGKSVSSLLPGDLLFYGGSNNGRYRGIYHVSMYVGKIDGVDMEVEAYGVNYGVVYQPIRTKRLVSICRPVN